MRARYFLNAMGMVVHDSWMAVPSSPVAGRTSYTQRLDYGTARGRSGTTLGPRGARARGAADVSCPPPHADGHQDAIQDALLHYRSASSSLWLPL